VHTLLELSVEDVELRVVGRLQIKLQRGCSIQAAAVKNTREKNRTRFQMPVETRKPTQSGWVGGEFFDGAVIMQLFITCLFTSYCKEG